MKSIDIIAGARPNFVKIAPIIHAVQRFNQLNHQQILFRLIHTGQHYDKVMSESFFEQLEIPQPDINFHVGSGSQATQTGKIMVGYENALKEHCPDLCVVVGDVTSTMACTIVAKKDGVKVAHVEGGIRSGDQSMPEEINRMITNSITDYFFTTSMYANQNLLKLGQPVNSIFFVGNTMIDSLRKKLSDAKEPTLYKEHDLDKEEYVVLTLHRPSNVDSLETLSNILESINGSVKNKKVIFTAHPRTKKKYDELGMDFKNLMVTGAKTYLEFLFLVKNSIGVITDSGGISDETTFLGIPCLSLRTKTERPETITIGTNELCGNDPEKIKFYLNKIISGNWKKGSIPELWDGKAAERIVDVIAKLN